MTQYDLNHRRAPFLQRNWLKGIKSRLSPSKTFASITSEPLASDSDDIAPASKRRRLSTPESLHLDRCIASPDKTSDAHPALRIQVLQLHHTDCNKVRTSLDGTTSRHVNTTKVNCRITFNDLTYGQKRVLHCQNQVCHLSVSTNSATPHHLTKVHLPRPFYIPFESLCVNKDDGTFDLPHAHELVVEFESAGSNPWLPLDTKDFDSSPLLSDISHGFLALASRFSRFYGRLKEPLILSARHKADTPNFTTGYVMDVDLRWSSGFRAQKSLVKDLMSCNTTGDDSNPNAGDVNSPSVIKQGLATFDSANGNSLHSDSGNEQTQMDRTPSRSLRARERNKIYNLKVLSDQAIGKNQKTQSDAGLTALNGRVSYMLPTGHVVSLDFYCCVACGSCHESLLHLQMHLRTCHPNYDYSYEDTNQGPRFRVSYRPSDGLLLPKNFMIKPTAQPFDLQAYVSGNSTWVTSRVVADADDDLLIVPRAETPTAKKSVLEPFSSPVIDGASCSPVESPTFTLKTPLPERTTEIKKSQVLVPQTSQPLYHPISKAVLQPGEPVPDAISDQSWLFQKHRESVAEFSDVTPAEMEFMWEWDGYILTQNITAGILLSHAWLRFVKLKTDWLLAKPERMLEFGKHACVLIAREVLTSLDIKEAMEHIYTMRCARALANENAVLPSNTETTAASLKDVEVKKNSNGCAVCQRPVRGPRILVCANKTCRRRLYHSDCIEATAVVDVNEYEWFCNSCAPTATE